ncbi:PREDICTED: uncharacterized protein LOC106114571 [Papilio xuthus]|uniref:Uncharacterized protein LOC106114571 n=1 Tax=Papilio xuthus TaxID=66420 RepID=A0AAJ7E5C1_PAPXU|nr:PREDICTED: uncharacterized protein LOC106114571 [Papilio xuthus]
MAKCGGCGKFLPTTGTDIIVCSKCDSQYHRECARLTRTNKAPREWVCPACSSKKSRTPQTVTDASSSSAQSSPVDTGILQAIESAVARQFEKFDKKFAELSKDLAFLREIGERVAALSSLCDGLQTQIHSSKDQYLKLEVENRVLRSTVQDLSTRLTFVEQQSRQNNIEITGLPENKSENLITTVVQLKSIVSSSIKESDIVSVVRTRKTDKNSNRPRAVVVKLSSIKARDDLLASVTKFNRANKDGKLSSQHLGYGGTVSPVFVAEHLSPANKILHAETRKFAREKGFKFVWVRDGRILVRKHEGAPAKQIRNLDSLKVLQE